jgi:hypothetical protein
MKVYIVIETCEDSIDFDPIKGVYATWEGAKEHLDELAEYCGIELKDEAFEFTDDSGYYAGIEEHGVEP